MKHMTGEGVTPAACFARAIAASAKRGFLRRVPGKRFFSSGKAELFDVDGLPGARPRRLLQLTFIPLRALSATIRKTKEKTLPSG
ncbi:MAG TPA: hypothetical protein VFE79_02210 [Paraburkholderia sp.]|jgi:hypothetical protein|nr:hypothetical protein [Paraburkholderia sp.]